MKRYLIPLTVTLAAGFAAGFAWAWYRYEHPPVASLTVPGVRQ